jgi:hypothetical protein
VSADADDERVDGERTESSFTDESVQVNYDAMLTKVVREFDWNEL